MAEYSAVIAGATGATGREFVCFLLTRERCTRVTVLVRDAKKCAAKLEKTAAGTAIDQDALKKKLQMVEFDYEALCSEGSDGAQAKKLAGHSVGINCLGTTKKDAGGLKGWMRVDRDYYNAFTRGLRAQGVPSLIQISWAGASPTSFFAQPRTKGECDKVSAEAGFSSLVVLRPGLLDRGDQARPIEKFGMFLLSAMKVAKVSDAGVLVYERSTPGDEKSKVQILENSDITKFILASGEPLQRYA